MTSHAFGHGFAGARFFPATLSTDDPFVSDELSLPTVSTIRTPDDGGTRETDISVDIAKRITPQFGIEIGETLTALNPHEGHAVNGFGNLEFAGKYQLLKNAAHEAIVSVGLGVEIGGTGSSSIGADSFSTWAPAIFFGKGFGDLPEALRFLKPIAITGVAGIAIPTSASTRTNRVNDQTGERDIEIERHPDVLEWGFALEYSVIYLSIDSARGVRNGNSAKPRRRRSNHRHSQSGCDLGGKIFSGWGGGGGSDQRTHRK